jgi:hypothetical protein
VNLADPGEVLGRSDGSEVGSKRSGGEAAAIEGWCSRLHSMALDTR